MATLAANDPLELLWERPELPRFGLQGALSAMYGGDFGIAPGRTFVNFVASPDGVVGLRDGGESGRIVSGGSAADRFVMALLRACADAVVIGAGTFRRAAGAHWRAADAYPELSEDFSELRRRLGLSAEPLLVVVTASGEIDSAQPALEQAWVATTRAGGERLSGRLAAGARVLAFDSDVVPLPALLDTLRAQGLTRILSEGGPTLFGELLQHDLAHELFLTVSPQLFGRSANDGRKSLVDGVELDGRALALASVRRHGSHLFLRYLLSDG